MVVRTALRPRGHAGYPQLPPEMWDSVIDFVAGAESSQLDLRTCSLVCHAFLPRSLIHLYQKLDLRSAAQLAQVVHRLSNSPILRNRVRYLIIDAKDSVTQSWVSLVPIRLQIHILTNCRSLVLRGVDLSAMHSHAKTALTCLRQRLLQVTLEDIHYFSPLQLARFFHVAENVVLRYSSHYVLKDRNVACLGRSPPSPMGRNQFQGGWRYFDLSMSWVIFAQVTRDWDLSACIGGWDIVLYLSGDSQEATGRAAALANITNTLEHLCKQPFGKSNITIRIKAPYTTELKRSEWFLYIYFSIQPC